MIISFNYTLLITIFGVTLGALVCVMAKVFFTFFISFFIILILKKKVHLLINFLTYVSN